MTIFYCHYSFNFYSFKKYRHEVIEAITKDIFFIRPDR